MRTTPDEHASGRGPDTTAHEQDLSHDNPRRQREPLIPYALRVAIFISSGGPPRGVLIGLPWPGQ